MKVNPYRSPQQVQAVAQKPKTKFALENPQESLVSKADSLTNQIQKDGKYLQRSIRRADRGAEFDSAELIRMQAVAYRYSENVGLATKVVEQVCGGAKQILNTQV